MLWNQAAAEITGYSEEEMLGKGCYGATGEVAEGASSCSPFCGASDGVDERCHQHRL